MNPKVEELFKIIQEAENELNKFRSKCPHSNYYLGMWSWRVGCFDPARICTECNDLIAYISYNDPEYEKAKLENTTWIK